MFKRKYWKIHNLYSSNKKGSYKNWKKSKEIYKKHILHVTVYWYFVATSLSNLVNNISERIYKIKFKYRHADKKCQTCQNKYKYCDCFLEYINFKD